ncbi:hypothetical protein [Halomicrococcus sp. SG-WS-1]|uniref:hypothetical protein n=1 Tax=Halomicrococcus sp. SG-WS-1 TaxID=3439057 RepID=UPI003F7B21E6
MALDTATGRLNFFDLAREASGAVYRSVHWLVVVSLGWTLCAATVVLAAPATATAVWLGTAVVDHDPVAATDLASAFRRYFWRSQALAIPAYLLVNGIVWPGYVAVTTGNALAGVAAFLAVDALIVYCFLAVYAIPILVESDVRARVAFRRSAELAVADPTTTLAVVLFAGTVTTVLVATVAGWVLVGPGFLGAILALATRYRVAGETL